MSLPKPYYEHAGITIYHADCREILEHLPKVDLVLTDPPYGIAEKMKGGTWGQQYDQTYQGWDAQTNSIILEIEKFGEDCIVWGGNYYPMPPSRCWLVHDKTYRGMTFADCELAWTNLDANARVLTFQVPRGFLGEHRFHPTQKPIEVMAWSIRQSKDAQTILDPFMGSGTTLVAAKQLGRQAIGIELEERYCEIAALRLSQDLLPFGGEE